MFTDRGLLADYLKTRQIIIPDLKPIFHGWPGVYESLFSQTQLEDLRVDVNRKLQNLYSQKAAKSLTPLLAADFAYFTVSWWPHARLEEQRILAALVIWLFTWDDEIDEPGGAVSDDFDAAEQYRAETERFVSNCLQLSEPMPNSQDLNPIVASFQAIGDALCDAYDESQRQRLLSEIQLFMRMSRSEQQIRLLGRLPSLEEYWTFRMGTSAVYIGVASGEYANRCPLPASIMDSQTMRDIWDETNIIISITNDLLSLKKEIRQGCVDSVVPLTCAALMDVDLAIQDVVAQLEASRQRFEVAARDLETQNAGESEEMRERIRHFIRVCQTNCTGNLIWSLKTARYGMAEKDVQVDEAGNCTFGNNLSVL
ncbi:isoprenoid synthase domain-containing protein [Calycina marina]|uniref:Terpene synthase n=1 Tax=Calycina marina TaxID=1763456 RepID=A0A9P7Z009_9HELO|nr:isoprenoid synthase domain-containing protein [Calycina marina]